MNSVSNYSPELSLDSLFPTLNDESFLQFLKSYYGWLQSTKLTVSDVVPTNTKNFFSNKEVIVGQNSKSTAVIRYVDLEGKSIVVDMTTNKPFDYNEVVVGQTSGVQATIFDIKDNVVRELDRFQKNRNQYDSTGKYFEELKDVFNYNFPNDPLTDRRLIVNKIRDLYTSKSNEQAYRFIFKILYNEEIEFYYPGEDVLRVSDGKFEKTQTLRTAVTPRIFEFLNKIIRGRTSGSLANVVEIRVFYEGAIEIAEMTLRLVSGPFFAEEIIESLSDSTLTTSLYGMITGFDIIDGGSGYQVGNPIAITGDGSQAQALVSSISEAPISALQINSIGHGYRNGVEAYIDNTGTGGSGLSIKVTEISNTYSITQGSNTYTLGEISKVSIINRGSKYYRIPTISLIDETIASLGLLSEKLISIDNPGENYEVGDDLIFSGGSGSNAEGKVASVVESVTYDLLFEDDSRIIIDGSYEDILKDEDWIGIGPIARIELTNFGENYTTENLPTIIVSTSSGSNAQFTVLNIQGKSASVSVDVSNNEVGIGSIRAINLRNFGVNYSSANADATISGDGNAILVPQITGLGIKSGNWVNDDGKIAYKFLQDSFFYQDYSYVIRSGLAFNVYNEKIKKLLHPAGMQAFGEILLFDFVDLSANISVDIQIRKVLDTIIQLFLFGDASMSVEAGQEYVVSNFSLANLQFDAKGNVTRSVDILPLISTISTLDKSEYIIKQYNKSRVDIEFEGNVIPKIILQNDVDVEVSQSLKQYTLKIKDSFETSGNIVFSRLDRFIESDISTEFVVNTDSYILNVINSQKAHSLFFREIRILNIADNQILEFADKTFEDEFVSELLVTGYAKKNVKINGTVSIVDNVVYGTNTDFTSDFVINDYLIVGNEKFIVTNVANSSILQINVSASENYENSLAFKEVSA